MKIIKKGNITSVPGFRASGINCGIKKGKKDLALLVSDVPAVSAAVFTANRVKAAPVVLSQKLVQRGSTQAIIVNSGNANACTGEKGFLDSRETLSLLSEELAIPERQLLIASTGKIGEHLPMEKVKSGIPNLVKALSSRGSEDFSEAILTTDKVKKSIAFQYFLGKKEIWIGGTAKGSGMICPNMATMLAFVTTNLSIEPKILKAALKESVEKTFNSITVDGDMSTNDSVFCLANGLAENKTVQGGAHLKQFVKALTLVNAQLARMIVEDGEGATKVVEVCVCGAKSVKDAKKIAFSIANSNLVKTAFFGEDPNWGRILSSAGAVLTGRSQYDFSKVDIWFDDCLAVKNGVYNTPCNQAQLQKELKKKNIRLVLDLKQGKHYSEVLTSDLSYEYVKINAEYRT